MAVMADPENIADIDTTIDGGPPLNSVRDRTDGLTYNVSHLGDTIPQDQKNALAAALLKIQSLGEADWIEFNAILSDACINDLTSEKVNFKAPNKAQRIINALLPEGSFYSDEDKEEIKDTGFVAGCKCIVAHLPAKIGKREFAGYFAISIAQKASEICCKEDAHYREAELKERGEDVTDIVIDRRYRAPRVEPLVIIICATKSSAGHTAWQLNRIIERQRLRLKCLLQCAALSYPKRKNKDETYEVADILVSTPGRLASLLTKGVVSLGQVRLNIIMDTMFVLPETMKEILEAQKPASDVGGKDDNGEGWITRYSPQITVFQGIRSVIEDSDYPTQTLMFGHPMNARQTRVFHENIHNAMWFPDPVYVTCDEDTSAIMEIDMKFINGCDREVSIHDELTQQAIKTQLNAHAKFRVDDEEDQKKACANSLDIALVLALRDAMKKGPKWTAVIVCSKPDVCNAVVEFLNKLHCNPNFASTLRSSIGQDINEVKLMAAELMQFKNDGVIDGDRIKHVLCAGPEIASIGKEYITCPHMILYDVCNSCEHKNPASGPQKILMHCATIVHQAQLANSSPDTAGATQPAQKGTLVVLSDPSKDKHVKFDAECAFFLQQYRPEQVENMPAHLQDAHEKFLREVKDESKENVPPAKRLDHNQVEWSADIGDFVSKGDTKAE